jgi:RNA polymerase sigma factor (sigma-70 family)
VGSRSHDQMGLSEQEIEAVYAARYRSFRHGAAAIVGDYERAHDVVQEAFARALSGRRGFRGGSPEAWVWRIVERQALDARRLPLGVEWQDSFAIGAEDPERDAELAAALAGLPARRRLVVFLRYFADLPYGDIARLCGIDEAPWAPRLPRPMPTSGRRSRSRRSSCDPPA